MDNGAYELPPPPDLHQVAAEKMLSRNFTEQDIDAVVLEMVYEYDGPFIVDRLIAQTLR